MKPTRFRAYAKVETVSRRDTDQGKQNLTHDVEDVIVSGATKDGVASFKADREISRVVFYGGKLDEEVCLGTAEGPFPAGEVTAELQVEPDGSAPPASEKVAVDGKTYRPA